MYTYLLPRLHPWLPPWVSSRLLILPFWGLEPSLVMVILARTSWLEHSSTFSTLIFSSTVKYQPPKWPSLGLLIFDPFCLFSLVAFLNYKIGSTDSIKYSDSERFKIQLNHAVTYFRLFLLILINYIFHMSGVLGFWGFELVLSQTSYPFPRTYDPSWIVITVYFDWFLTLITPGSSVLNLVNSIKFSYLILN